MTDLASTPTLAARRDDLEPAAACVRQSLADRLAQPACTSGGCPRCCIDVTIQPVMFVLLFAFVFGGVDRRPGAVDYRELLMPGIMAQTMVFSSFIVAIGLVSDLEKGIVDRIRSLPIRALAVLVGRSISSMIHSSIGIFVMALTGLAIGWRIHNGVAEAVLALRAAAALRVRDDLGRHPRSARPCARSRPSRLMFTVMFPLTFLANTFARPRTCRRWLRTIAEWNPISSLMQAMRELWGNGPPALPDAALPLQYPVLTTVIWSVAITAVVAPLAVRA